MTLKNRDIFYFIFIPVALVLISGLSVSCIGFNASRRPTTAAAAISESSTNCLSVSGTDYVYLADMGNNRIVRFTDITSNGTATTAEDWVAYGSAGAGTDQFFVPQGIATDSTGRIYISDTGNNRIVRIDDMCGTNWTTLAATGLGAFSSPRGIAIASSDVIVVVDGGNDRVIAIDDIVGTNPRSLGATGFGVNQFKFPSHISLVSTLPDRVLVSDSGNSRVARLFVNPAAVTWDTDYGTNGIGNDNFDSPRQSLSRGGFYYTADMWNNRIVSYSTGLVAPDGLWSTVVDGFSAVVVGLTLARPMGMCKSERGLDDFLFITDIQNNQIFKHDFNTLVNITFGDVGGLPVADDTGFNTPMTLHCVTQP